MVILYYSHIFFFHPWPISLKKYLQLLENDMLLSNQILFSLRINSQIQQQLTRASIGIDFGFKRELSSHICSVKLNVRINAISYLPTSWCMQNHLLVFTSILCPLLFKDQVINPTLANKNLIRVIYMQWSFSIFYFSIPYLSVSWLN